MSDRPGAPDRAAHDREDGSALPFSYAETLARLAAVRIDEPDVEQVLDRLLSATQHAMVRSVSLSVTAIEADTDRYVTAASTSPTARAVDEFEYDLDEGPCIDTLHTGREHRIEDVDHESRWPRFCARASEAGYRAVAGLPLRVGERTVGAINLYAGEVAGLDEDLALARRLMAPAAIVLENANAYRRSQEAVDEVHAELDALARTHQAIGILMVRRGCDVHEAERLLRATAEATDRDVDEVAERLIASADPDPSTGT